MGEREVGLSDVIGIRHLGHIVAVTEILFHHRGVDNAIQPGMIQSA